MSITENQARVRKWLEERPTLLAHNRDPLKVLTLASLEIIEAIEARGDKDKLGHELADVMWYVLSLAETEGIDLETAFQEKVTRNEAKYKPDYFQYGDYEEARNRARKEWAEAGGDEAWFTYFSEPKQL